MFISLEGRIALVCGASQGIGKAIAYQFAKSGARVILLARNEEKLKQIVFDLNEITNKEHYFICCDISNHSQLEHEVHKCLEIFESIDILVNNTGGPPPGNIINSELKDFELAFKQHILSAQLLVRLLIPSMKERGYGRIINIVSVGMREPIENLGVSNTIRGAMGSWAKTLSREVSPFGITVNNILPGYTDTERLRFLITRTAEQNQTSFNEEFIKIIQKVPSKRLGKPEEIGFLATFLASDYSGYINGASIPIDGGFLSSI